MNEGVKKFIMLVGAHFPRQKFAGEEEREALWLRSMGEILGEFDEDVLMAAAGIIVRTRDPKEDGSMFPKPVECIRACESVLRRRETAEILAAAPARQMQQISKALPSFETRPGDAEWEHWLAHMKAIGRHDLVGEAERNGLIRASSRWPRHGSVLFDPNPETNEGFLKELLTYKPMPN